MPLGQAVKAQQQVIVILLQMRFGTGHQRIEVLGLAPGREEEYGREEDVAAAVREEDGAAAGREEDRCRGSGWREEDRCRWRREETWSRGGRLGAGLGSGTVGAGRRLGAWEGGSGSRMGGARVLV